MERYDQNRNDWDSLMSGYVPGTCSLWSGWTIKTIS
jgi:hypothetical protein